MWLLVVLVFVIAHVDASLVSSVYTPVLLVALVAVGGARCTSRHVLVIALHDLAQLAAEEQVVHLRLAQAVGWIELMRLRDVYCLSLGP